VRHGIPRRRRRKEAVRRGSPRERLAKKENAMTKPKSPKVAPPHVLLEDEPVAVLAKQKKSLAGRWSYTRAATLDEAVGLATCLHALERDAEAAAIVSAICVAIPAPPPLPRGGFNYTLWSPATGAHALLVRLELPLGTERAERSRAALRDDACHARDNPEYVAWEIAEARAAAEGAGENDTPKWARATILIALKRCLLIDVMAATGDSLFAPHGAEAAALIPQLIARLRRSL
jgi:hypothetical protein